MKKQQSGFSSILLIVIVILILGGILFAYDKSKTPTNYSNQGINTTETPVINSNNTTNTGSTAVTPSANTSQPGSGSAVITTTSNVFPGGSEYRSPYGLALAFPASWQAYAMTKNTTSFGGVAPSDSTTFRLSTGPVLTINVFTKEQWNRIKTQENAANQNVNSLGEGEYLGENATYIYSFIIHDRESEVRQVLNNIISF